MCPNKIDVKMTILWALGGMIATGERHSFKTNVYLNFI